MTALHLLLMLNEHRSLSLPVGMALVLRFGRDLIIDLIQPRVNSPLLRRAVLISYSEDYANICQMASRPTREV